MHQKIIDFWFDEIDKSKWFVKDQAFDELIRSRFGRVQEKASVCELSLWRLSALGSLAEVIVLDQFSRNIFRDSAESFAYDSLALALAQSAIAQGLDAELTPAQRSFLYMPYMHSESLQIHEESTRLFTNLGIKANLDFELKHKAIIERFGRYPHRNRILGRDSTPEEEAFLKTVGSSF